MIHTIAEAAAAAADGLANAGALAILAGALAYIARSLGPRLDQIADRMAELTASNRELSSRLEQTARDTRDALERIEQRLR